jgi:hypothetical protein
MNAILTKLKTHLVADWHEALKWSSVRLHLIVLALAALYEVMPALDPNIAAMLPGGLPAKATGAYAIVGLILRLTKLKSDG